MKGRTLSLIVSIFLISLVLMVSGSPIISGEEQEVLLEPDEIGVEVLLNDNDLSFNTSILVELVYDGFVNIPGWSPYLETFSMDIDLRSGPFLFRSHYNSELGVIMAKENFTERLKEQGIEQDMDGWTITILILGTIVQPDPRLPMEYMLKPDADINVSSIDWGSVMETELQWLTEMGVVDGLDGSDILGISERSELGTMGINKRVFFDHGTQSWMIFDQFIFAEIFLIGGSLIYPVGSFPDSATPIPRDDADNIMSTMIILVSTILIALLIGSFFYQRVDRAVRLNNARRKLIYEMVLGQPGIHFSAIMKELNLKPGVASYHINRLEKMELIKSYQDGMYRRFYLFEQKIEMKMSLSDLQKLIVNAIEDEPGISQVHISKIIGKSKVVINYHVRFLRDLGLLIMEREGRETHCFLTSQGIEFAHA